MRYFLDVSFSIPLHKDSLTYHFDADEDNPPPQIGTRVVVPLQRRNLIGYLLRIREEKPEFKTSSIIQILDDWPLLSPKLLELGLWMSRTCLCSPGEAFDAMIPSGVKQRIVRYIQALNSLQNKAAKAEEIPDPLRWLVQNSPAPLGNFVKTFPKASRRISSWVDDGLIAIKQERQNQAGPKIIRFLILPPKPFDPESLTPKEKLVIEYLLKENTPCTAARIRRGSGVSMGPIDQLLRKGILQEKDDRVFREVATEPYYSGEPDPVPLLTSDQENVLGEIRRNYPDGRPVLIWGVTCSGKTEIYLRWVAENLKRGNTAIVLVPEISLTPQMTKRFKDRFGKKVAILHSRLSEGERFDQWEQIRCGDSLVVVGARSAVFAPVRNLGTIIIDEEGEPTFKQNEAPRYHAREVARRRCELEGALLVMGSATPTMEAFHMAKTGDFQLAQLAKRVTNRIPPQVEVVDMRKELTTKKNRSMFSEALSKAIGETLQLRKQVILFLNRRGYSSFVFCRLCGEACECSRCKISLVYHEGAKILRCHYCGEARQIPKSCPSCGSGAIKFFGAGTQRIEAEARRYFPQARIQRLDSDIVAASGSLETILEAFGKSEIDILIGTQMVAKGLDFPEVILVGIMAADSLLRMPDFRASERNFSLLAQVSGRSGRGNIPGRVILQTYFPTHHSIRYAINEDYAGFFEEEAKHRQDTGFPPFQHVAMILFSSPQREKVKQVSEALFGKLRELPEFRKIEILGPAPAPLEMINNQYRFQLLAKFTDQIAVVEALRRVLSDFPTLGVRISVDFDPFFSM